MKSLVKTEKGAGHFALLDRPMPEPGDDEVLIQVAYTGICGTDIHIYHDQFPYWPPVIVGHEFSGTVVKTGRAVDRFQEGDRVVGEPHNLFCGNCRLCRTGHIQLCEQKRSIGWGIDGAFAEYVKMPQSLLHLIPQGVSLEEAALAEPCAIVAHQVIERGNIRPQDTVVIMGLGPIALIAAQMARCSGAGTIILAGCTSDEGCRLTAAKQTGCFDTFVNVQKDSLLDTVMEQTGGAGADIVIEASGAASAIQSSVQVLKKRGTFCAIGMNGKPMVEFPWDDAMRKALDLQFNMSSSYEGWRIALELMKHKKLSLMPLVSEILPLEQWEKAFEDIASGQAIKVLLTADGKGR